PTPSTSVLLHTFSFMSTPPPSSTLFPYTTLFRSVFTAGTTPRSAELRSLTAQRNPKFKVEGREISPEAITAGFNNYYEFLTDKRDRKSTRLNSSHVAISYAVFCLKKKKINSQLTN